VRRRNFITLLGSAAAWPIAAWGQQPSMPVIGWLSSAAAADWPDMVDAFREGLKDTGYIDGRNVRIEFRWAEGVNERLQDLAADLVRQRVSVIFTSGGHLSALAAKAATTSIPIVFVSGNDPIEFGLVRSLSRPEGNLTGLSMIASALGPKQLSLLRELVPKAAKVALIANPANPNGKVLAEQLQTAARDLGIQFETLMVSGERGLDAAFAALATSRADGLIVANDTFLRSLTSQFAALAERHSIPAIYPYREWVAGGCLISYGPSLTREMHGGGVYTGRVLNGAKPSDLPVLQPTTFDLVINLKAAKALGLNVPPTLLARVDEVIE
jgi:putative ABC transport system substrate-binding protein